MKAQLRLAGGRRKLGRNGFSSDKPRECVDPPEYLRDPRDLEMSILAVLRLQSRVGHAARESTSDNTDVGACA